MLQILQNLGCTRFDFFSTRPYHRREAWWTNHSRNLSWSCLDCNSYKGPNIAGRDANQTVRLFDPRKDDWKKHFDWNGPILVGRTAIGRATIDVLRINITYRVAVRASLIDEESLS